MKESAFYSIVAGLAFGAMFLPETALAEKRTPFESTETDTTDFAWFTDGPDAYLFDGSATFEVTSEQPRVAGSGWYQGD